MPLRASRCPHRAQHVRPCPAGLGGGQDLAVVGRLWINPYRPEAGDPDAGQHRGEAVPALGLALTLQQFPEDHEGH